MRTLINKRPDPWSDCHKLTSSLSIPLTALPTGKNIFTPISNQAKVLAPFEFQLKMQASSTCKLSSSPTHTSLPPFWTLITLVH